MQKILVVGGYGIFGGRLVELLESEETLTIFVGGRSLQKAKDFCEARTLAKAHLIPAAFDRTHDLSAQLSSIKPDIVVDASGPFQHYGAGSYHLIESCLAAKIHYLDLADGADFVAGVAAYDQVAKEAGVFILSGVSSFPVLTALVLRELSKDMMSIDTVYGGIAPSPFAVVGENVIRAIASYAGQPIEIKKNGTWGTAYPFTQSLRHTVSPPGRLPLKNILFSLVEVPDLRVLPQLYPDTKTVWMGAGPVPEILHRALIGFSWLVRWKIIPSLTPIVKLIQFVMNTFRWGEHRGGMFVEVTGKNAAGGMARKSWHLLAEGRDGPFIPCMAVEAIIRKILAGETIQHGARAPIEDIALGDYNKIFENKTIYTGFRQDAPLLPVPLYKHVMGDAWSMLPLPITTMHEVGNFSAAKGHAVITRGDNPLSCIVANLFGFPKAGTDIPVRVEFSQKDGTETWKRIFAGKAFQSHQYAGRKKWERLLVERFGPFHFAMALVWEDKKLKLVLRHWDLLGIPLPLWMCPHSDSYETVEDGKFRFNVEISHPLLGKIIHYTGWLEKE